MNLTIKNSSNRKSVFIRLMNGNIEFCTTNKLSDAMLIVNAMKNVEPEKKPDIPDIDAILQSIKDLTGIDLRTNQMRTRDMVNIRYIFCRIAKDSGYSLSEIAAPIGIKSHASIIHAIKKFNDFYETEKGFRELYHKIKP